MPASISVISTPLKQGQVRITQEIPNGGGGDINGVIEWRKITNICSADWEDNSAPTLARISCGTADGSNRFSVKTTIGSTNQLDAIMDVDNDGLLKFHKPVTFSDNLTSSVSSQSKINDLQNFNFSNGLRKYIKLTNLIDIKSSIVGGSDTIFKGTSISGLPGDLADIIAGVYSISAGNIIHTRIGGFADFIGSGVSLEITFGNLADVNKITKINVDNPGSGYKLNDQLTIPAGTIPNQLVAIEMVLSTSHINGYYTNLIAGDITDSNLTTTTPTTDGVYVAYDGIITTIGTSETGDSGFGVSMTITVLSNTITSIKVNNIGNGYAAGNILTIPALKIHSSQTNSIQLELKDTHCSIAYSGGIRIGASDKEENIFIGTNNGPFDVTQSRKDIMIGNSNINSRTLLQSDVYSLKNFYRQSDRRVKKNISTIENATTKINKLRPVNYVLKSDPKSKVHMGFIAQELGEIFPDLINGSSDEYLSVNYTGIIGLLVAGMKEQNKTIENLNEKFDKLTTIVDKLELCL